MWELAKSQNIFLVNILNSHYKIDFKPTEHFIHIIIELLVEKKYVMAGIL